MMRKIKAFLLTNQNAGQTIVKNSFWLAVSNIGGRLTKAALIVYSARVLGAEQWGLFSYAVSFAALITIFTDFGIGPILTREASKTDDPIKKSKIISTTFFLKIALLVLAVLVVIFVAPKVATIKEATFLFPIISLIIIFDTFQGFGTSLFRALEKMEFEAFFYLLTNISIVVFGFLTLKFYPEVKYFSYAYAAGTAVGAVATLYKLRKYLKNLIAYFDRKLVKPVLGAAWPFVISGVLGSLMINTDILLIGFFLSAEAVGVYSAAERPIQLLYLLPAIMATSVFPTLSRLASKNSEKMAEVLGKILGLASLVSAPLVIGGIVLGGDMIREIFGQQYTGAVASFRVLLATLSINFTTVILSNAIFAYDRQKDLVKFAAIGGTMNVVLDLILIPRFGILGSAFATFFAQATANLYIWMKVRQKTKPDVVKYLKKIVPAAVVMGLIVFGLHRAGLNFILNIGVGAVIYLGLLYALKEPLLKEIKLILRGGASSAPESSELASL